MIKYPLAGEWYDKIVIKTWYCVFENIKIYLIVERNSSAFWPRK